VTEVYRKWGRVVRYENGITVRVEEAGEAIEKDGVFRSAPMVPPYACLMRVPSSG
jgi:hypothetical protein